MTEKRVVWFQELTKDDISIAGGKGANLGEMTRAGFPVPPGFCITAQVYFDYIKRTGLKKKIMDILNRLDVNNTERLHESAMHIKEIMTKSPMPQDIKDEIRQEYRRLCLLEGDQAYVAVRSSATAEDLPEASFAGQQDTYLDIQGENELIKAVRRCWASLFTPRAIFYREKKGFPHDKVGLSAVVQKMIESEVSGVMFTTEPTGKRDEIIIEGGYGLGEAIVGGKITPDTYIVDKKTFEIKSKKISTQQIKIMRSRIQVGTTKAEIPPDKQKSQKLMDSKIKELAQIGNKIEEHYMFPQDIEWAVEKGQLYILQSRAITTIKKKEENPDGTIKKEEPTPDLKGEAIAKGMGASPGIGQGKVKIVYTMDDLPKVQEGDVLITKMTNPDMVPAMSRASAIVTDEGGTTSHAAIVSREMGVPCIVGTTNISDLVADGDELTVDANHGIVYRGILDVDTEQPKQDFTDLPQTKTHVYMNLGVPKLAEKYKDYPIDGIGLLREEFIIATHVKEHPLKLIKEGKGDVLVNQLADGIEQVAKAFAPRPVVLRLSDFKTDEYKQLQGGEEFEVDEANPMMGWRGCSRYYHPKYEEAFLLEVKAIKKVRETCKNLWVMLPFVRTIDELEKVKEIFEEHGIKRGPDFKLWLMAEIPSNAFLAEEFADRCDGFSIGSNDLTQLVLGVDRNSKMLEQMGLFETRNPAVKKAIQMIIKGAHAKGSTVSICGQAPSNYPEFTKFLVEQGIDSISVNPDVVAKTRRIIANVEKGQHKPEEDTFKTKPSPLPQTEEEKAKENLFTRTKQTSTEPNTTEKKEPVMTSKEPIQKPKKEEQNQKKPHEKKKEEKIEPPEIDSYF